MNTDNLAPVFLDNQPISLKDPKPKVSAVLSAGGKPEATDVKWLQFVPNTPGKTVRAEEVLDRTTDPNRPIYLTSASKGLAGTGAGSKVAGTAAPVLTAPAKPADAASKDDEAPADASEDADAADDKDASADADADDDMDDDINSPVAKKPHGA